MKLSGIGTSDNKRTKKYSGFESYLENKTFTPSFCKDFEYWARKIFKNWTLFIDFEDFYAKCWEALLEKINEFDPNIATIQTFCISRINNEAWRQYMKNKTIRPEVDSDDEVIQGDLVAKNDDDELHRIFFDFVLYANQLGVQVNEEELYADYTECKDSPGMLAFAAWRGKNKEVGMRNDIFKRKQ